MRAMKSSTESMVSGLECGVLERCSENPESFSCLSKGTPWLKPSVFLTKRLRPLSVLAKVSGHSSTSYRVLHHHVGPLASEDGNHSGGESDATSSDDEEQSAEDLDAALQGVAVSRSSSVSKSLRGGMGTSFSAATKQLPDDYISTAAPGVAPSRGALLDNRKFQFHGLSQGMPASLPISAGGIGRQLRPISELRANTTTMSGFNTESKMVRPLQSARIV